jgi:hypothetical protein
VCVPEFIDFFTSSSSTRVARAAAAAVRVSLNMLQLEVAEVAEDTDSNNVTEVTLHSCKILIQGVFVYLSCNHTL